MNDFFALPRRSFLALLGSALSAGLVVRSGGARALPPTPAGLRHGMSIFGELKYAPGFTHFDYANPQAPKSGTLSQTPVTGGNNVSLLTFDTLNGYILKGNAPPGLDYVFDTLMARAYDEPDALYGLVAESVEMLELGNRLVFHLREARFHDGAALTAEDVAFSFKLLKAKGYPLIAQHLREMEDAKALDKRTLEIRFTGKQTRDLPLYIAGELPIFSKVYYTANDFDKTTLMPPLGSGPYKIGAFKAGDDIVYERVDDYWARDINVNVGQWNFERIRFEFYRDVSVAFQAFTAGQYLCREEFSSKLWATQYNFPALKDGRVKRESLPDQTPSGAQGWFINTRLDKFKDVRVREALNLAFDFEWSNKNLFYGLYTRTQSFFENSTMKAEGEPSADEFALLAPFRDVLPREVFGPVVSPPVTDGSGQDRKLLRQASALLDAAGWTIVNGARQNAKGETFTFEFLGDEPQFERIESPFIKNLRLLGIEAQSRFVDSSQFQDRLKNYDFDILIQRYALGITPGIEMRDYWSSRVAQLPGGHNLSAIANPAVDALIEKVIAAPTREAQIITARALDRTLRAGRYWIPQWYKASHSMAYWDIYDRPAILPKYERGVERCWWVDAAKAKKLGVEE